MTKTIAENKIDYVKVLNIILKSLVYYEDLDNIGADFEIGDPLDLVL